MKEWNLLAWTDPGDKAQETHSVMRLDAKRPTLGKLIQADGYATAHFGKWHLGCDPYIPENMCQKIY